MILLFNSKLIMTQQMIIVNKTFIMIYNDPLKLTPNITTCSSKGINKVLVYYRMIIIYIFYYNFRVKTQKRRN